jgi:hypothetical protein
LAQSENLVGPASNKIAQNNYLTKMGIKKKKKKRRR